MTLFATALTIRSAYLALLAQNFTSADYWLFFADTAYFRDVAQWWSSGASNLEESLILVGPGYGFILHSWSLVVGDNAWGHLTLSVVVSSASCLLIRQLALQLGLSERIALLAGYFHAVSLTGVALSATLYSETWFVFLALLTVIQFVKALNNSRVWDYLAFAALCASAAFVRSVGQFLPLIFLAIVAVQAFTKHKICRKTVWLPMMFILLSLMLITLWPLRNHYVHQVFTISETGTGAAKRYWIAAGVNGSYDGSYDLEQIEATRATWDQQLFERYGPEPTIRQRHEFNIGIVRDTALKYPSRMIGAYLSNVWTNMTDESRMQRLQIPQLTWLWHNYSKRLASGLGAPLVILSLLGVLWLWYRRQRLAAVLLGALYLYLGLITGPTFWQDSRIFFPGQIAWNILVAVSLLELTQVARRAYLGHLRNRRRM